MNDLTPDPCPFCGLYHSIDQLAHDTDDAIHELGHKVTYLEQSIDQVVHDMAGTEYAVDELKHDMSELKQTVDSRLANLERSTWQLLAEVRAVTYTGPRQFEVINGDDHD